MCSEIHCFIKIPLGDNTLVASDAEYSPPFSQLSETFSVQMSNFRALIVRIPVSSAECFSPRCTPGATRATTANLNCPASSTDPWSSLYYAPSLHPLFSLCRLFTTMCEAAPCPGRANSNIQLCAFTLLSNYKHKNEKQVMRLSINSFCIELLGVALGWHRKLQTTVH